MKQLARNLCILLMFTGLGGQSLAADITKDEVENYFWKIIRSIQDERADYFSFFSEDALIDYKLPESYDMKGGKISLKEFEEVQRGFWQYTENHSFDLEAPVVKLDGEKATVTTRLYERYTMAGYTTTNETDQTYILKKEKGGIKVVEFINIVKDISDKEYQEKVKEKSVKKK